MNSTICLTNHFLIAMPQLHDPNFFHSVTYICQHDAQGAMGIMINRPMEMQLKEIFEHLEIDSSDATLGQQPIYSGGPVQTDRGFVLHRPSKNWQGTLFISDEIALTASSDILSDIAQHKGPQETLVALGYAGWGAGQLEDELTQNSWLSVPADADIIFSRPYEQRWHAAASLLGINLSQLSDTVGHA
jgi:putative transcriptional regulator